MLLAAAASAPWLQAHGYAVAGFGVRRFFSAVCQQREDRSFWMLGWPMAVCARCLGVYIGAAVGGFLRLRGAIALRLLGFAAMLNFADLVSESFGLHGNLPWVRLTLGVSMGVGIGATLKAVSNMAQRLLPIA